MGLIGWRALAIAGDANNLGLVGFGAAAQGSLLTERGLRSEQTGGLPGSNLASVITADSFPP